MGEDVTFRVVMALAVFITAFLHKRPPRRKSTLSPITNIVERMIPIVFTAWAASIVAYILGIGVELAVVEEIPRWARWAGAGLGIGCIVLSAWTQQHIGEQFSHKLEVWEGHRLVTGGPYRLVRHPRYAIFFLSAIAASLVSANLAVIVTGVVAAALLAPRIRKEEMMMLDRHGEQYRAYMQTTGAIVPRLRRL